MEPGAKNKARNNQQRGLRSLGQIARPARKFSTYSLYLSTIIVWCPSSKLHAFAESVVWKRLDLSKPVKILRKDRRLFAERRDRGTHHHRQPRRPPRVW